MERTLKITIDSDWKAGMKKAVKAGFSAERYVGERLNFESPAVFFGRLTERRWTIVRELQGAAGPVGVRELARRVGRDVKRVHEDVVALAELGLITREDNGAVTCPYADIHVDMHVRAVA